MNLRYDIVGVVEVEDLRVAVYQCFRATGRPPAVTDLAVGLAATESEVRSGLAELAALRHLVLGADGGILMAHPFSAVPLGFSVMGPTTLWWGGCCWDSFAVPHLVPEAPEVLVATRCPGCGTAGAWVVDRLRPPASDWLAHFLVPAARMWDDVMRTCGNQRLFCSQDCVEHWASREGIGLGYVMDIATLWRLASHWYDGRLDRGYVRRDPAASSDYLRSVGLDGPFWEQSPDH